MTILYIGLFLAILATLLFSVNNILIARALRPEKLTEGIFVTLVFSTISIWFFSVASGELNNIFTLTPEAWLLYIATGIVNFVIARTLNYTGLMLLGPSRNSAIVSSQILFAAFFAFVFLSESIDFFILIGVILSFLGIILVSLSQESKKGFSYLGISFALLTAFFVSLAVIMIREANLSSNLPIDGALISYITAVIIYFPYASYKQIVSKTFFSKKIFYMLSFGGLSSGLAQICRYSSLEFSPVVLVASIIATAPLVTMVFSFLMNKKYEILNQKLAFGSIITVIGVIIISISLKAI